MLRVILIGTFFLLAFSPPVQAAPANLLGKPLLGTLSISFEGAINSLQVLDSEKRVVDEVKDWDKKLPLIRTYTVVPGDIWLNFPDGGPARAILVTVESGRTTFVEISPIISKKNIELPNRISITVSQDEGSDFTLLFPQYKSAGLESFLSPVDLESAGQSLYFDTEPPWPLPPMPKPRPGSPAPPSPSAQ